MFKLRFPDDNDNFHIPYNANYYCFVETFAVKGLEISGKFFF